MGDDLNDYAYFVQVLAQGGFVITGLALREPKSKLSHRIAALEARLIKRSNRRPVDNANFGGSKTLCWKRTFIQLMALHPGKCWFTRSHRREIAIQESTRLRAGSHKAAPKV